MVPLPSLAAASAWPRRIVGEAVLTPVLSGIAGILRTAETGSLVQGGALALVVAVLSLARRALPASVLLAACPPEHRWCVALLDIQMPVMDGLTALAELGRAAPGVRVLILTTFGERRQRPAGARPRQCGLPAEGHRPAGADPRSPRGGGRQRLPVPGRHPPRGGTLASPPPPCVARRRAAAWPG
ncbi:hypothetical protein SVIOM342S_04082 [Streptomyces violaceorubidus]